MNQLHFKKDDFLFVLTGAGISAESGVKTFRDNNGLWENYRVEEVATPEAFQKNPALVWRFYEQRRKQLKEVQPNRAHRALAQLSAQLGPERFLLVTQNVDDLHERAGSSGLIHMHGELLKIRCTRCEEITYREEALLDDNNPDRLPHCECGGLLRPHIVWFGEIPFDMERIQQALFRCTHFLAIGTSGVVYPAAGFLSLAKQVNAQTIGINLEPPENHRLFDIFHQGRAGDVIPEWVNALEIEPAN